MIARTLCTLGASAAPFVSLFALSAPVAAQPAQESSPPQPVLVGKINHSELEEPSGLVKSQTYPGVYWVIGDSGAGNVIWPINAAGEVIAPSWKAGPGKKYYLGPKSSKEKGQKAWPGIEVGLAYNVDWEELALVNGKFYVLDLGNNNNDRRDLGIYAIPEPNPYTTQRVTAVARRSIAYGDQTFAADEPYQFDVEAHFVAYGSRLFFMTKHRVDRKHNRYGPNSKVYDLDLKHVEDVDWSGGVTTLTLRPQHTLPYFCPTGGSSSPNGRNVAIIGKDGIRIAPLGRFQEMENIPCFPLPLSAEVRTKLVSGDEVEDEGESKFEAICWDDDNTVRFCNEAGDIYTLDVSSVTQVNVNFTASTTGK